jgi:hypothetical protein
VNEMVAKEIYHQTVMWRGLGMLLRLRKMSDAERMKVMKEASELSLLEPVHIYFNDTKFKVESWDSKPISGAQVIALLVFGMWVHTGEKEDAAAGLLADWPELRQAMDIAAMEPA